MSVINLAILGKLKKTKADKSNVLELDNITPYTPSLTYHPTTKDYVDSVNNNNQKFIYGPTAPSSPEAGTEWYDTVNNLLLKWIIDNGNSFWLDITPISSTLDSFSTPDIITSSTSEVSIGGFDKASVRTLKVIIQASDTTDSKYHSSELLIIHDGTDAHVSEYSSIFTIETLATYRADIDGSNLNIYITPYNSNTIEFKTFITKL